MTIYLIKGYLGYAATTLADAQALLTALANPALAANQAAIDRITDKLETLVQGDTGEPIILSSIDDTAGTYSAWVTDASTTLALGLGDPDPNGNTLYASTLSSTISGNTRLATLALNTTALAAAVNRGRFLRPAPLTLQILTTTGGVTETRGLITLQISAPIFAGGTPVDLTPTTYVTTPVARAGYVINLSGVTSLTGGGATTLDGQLAGTATFPVGSIVLTSDGNIARHWRLLGTYLAATDLALGKIKPTNSDATLNPCYWQLI
jgi:hypothetical protein